MSSLALAPVLNEFLLVLNKDRTHIVNFPTYVFLCGGSLNSNHIRGKVYDRIKNISPHLHEKIKLAENYADWTDNEFYTNLIDLENDLGHIVTFVPIILESPGSIAELGAFVKTENIFQKIKVYILKKHRSSQSYISLGPIRKIEEASRENVFVYEEYMEESLIDSICQDIQDRTVPKHQSEIFREELDTHRILLICEFVKLLSLARVSEIQYLLAAFNVSMQLKDIKKYLKLCEKVGLLEEKSFGEASKDIFYNAKNDNMSFANFSFNSARRENKDMLKWKVKIRNEIIKKDSYRRAIFRALEERGV